MDFSFFLFSNNTNGSVSLLSSNEDDAETVGSISSLFEGCNEDSFGGLDAFGGKDIFGNPDCSNMDTSLFANNSQAETIGSVAYTAETIGSVAFCGASASSFSDAGSGASCSSAASSGASCGGGGGFTSVC